MENKVKKLMNQNNVLDKEINDENQSKYTDMICYLRGADISEYDIEAVRQDLIEMIVCAQKRGEDIGTVIGGDYKEFCDDVIANLPRKTGKQKLIDVLSITCRGISILFAINIVLSGGPSLIIQNIISKAPGDWSISISVGNAVSIILIVFLANFMVNGIMKNALKVETKRKKAVIFLGCFIITSVLIVIQKLGSSTLFTINIFLACAIIVALYAVSKVLDAI